ncbi:MAG TPA: isopentenyl-diphosphate Delta-isomerase [Propionibacteriaceae bacterium]
MTPRSLELDAPADNVVLLDADGAPIGEVARADVHSRHTPLHLAFSCYVTNDAGELLLTRRALSKRTWPGVWTNSCCGHPRPGEDMHDAIRRRLDDELRLTVGELECVLPDFAYTATDASGIVENEICPVFSAPATHPTFEVLPNPDEVMDWKWVKWDDLATSARLTPFVFSPWAVQQISLLDALNRRGG